MIIDNLIHALILFAGQMKTTVLDLQFVSTITVTVILTGSI